MSNIISIPLKRYAITLQHEVIVYAHEPERAKQVACKAYIKSKCIHLRELTSIETEALENPIIDNRTAPGS
jgi:hypothetical protein